MRVHPEDIARGFRLLCVVAGWIVLFGYNGLPH
jgi:hypothetical protein